GYHFYYETTKFDSLRITLQANNQSLQKILDEAFKSTLFKYTIDHQQVFLTKGREIKTGMAQGFFDQSIKPAVATTQIAEYADDKSTVTQATTENKLYQVGNKTGDDTPGNVILSGYVRDSKSAEPVIGASLHLEGTKYGVATDQFGFYTLSVPKGKHILRISAIGVRDTRRQIAVYSDGRLNIEVIEQVTSLSQVTISAEKMSNIRGVALGVTKLNIKSIKQVPTVFGEADVLRVVLTLPGVLSVGEATTGFNVRGGAADQNLILLDDATVYNPAHFFGFFAAFNPDIVKEIELYKSSIPEKFGGRLSSVLDIVNREGNKKKFTGTAGIGLLTSRLNLEGPIVKDKTSIIFGGRTTYSDWLLKLLPKEYKNSSASFFDLNLGISHQINEKNNLYFTGYYSQDAFRLNSDTTYKYSNRNFNLKWKHNFNNKLFGVFTVGTDRYNYGVTSTADSTNAYKLNFNISQSNFKADFTHYVNSKHTLTYGFNTIYYKLNPGNLQPNGPESLVIPDVVTAEQGLESALYLGDKFDITPELSISGGLRFSLFNFLGPKTVNYYAPGLPRNDINFTKSVTYGSNKVINTYNGPEIRASARYAFSSTFSVKAGYNTLRQYIHLLSNTTAISPTDIYKLSDPNIKPQYGDQVSFGIYNNSAKNTIETSVEVYYKRMRNYLDYKSGATLVLNHTIETDLLNTEGKAYGAEFMVRKNTGKLNGWMSYTYSRTFLRQDDPNAGELINGGEYYPANFDKPHSFNFTGNYRFTHRYSVSLNFTYSTGRPITLPIGKYNYGGSERVLYSDRNAYRIPDYMRADFSLNIEGNHKVKQLTHNTWTIGVYNLTGRQNPYSTYFVSERGAINGYQLSIFAKPIPFINYNIRF
ncbi:MAG: TonB-dependent receptor, partial [Sphingobacteriaceae bacterium]